MLVTARDRVAKLIAEGKNEGEVVAAKPLADIDAKIGVDERGSRNFIRGVYNLLNSK